MANDLVTVAIPAYNHQDFVQETINSIIAQTHENIELIIFNDGSTDNTDSMIKEILPKCKERFARVDYVSKENEGLAASWNRAIDWAKGDYLYAIASDDVAMPHAVGQLFDFMSKHPKYALAVGNNQIINEKSQKCYWDKQRNNTTEENAVYYSFADYLRRSNKGKRRFRPWRFGTYKTLINGNYIPNGKMLRVQSLIEVDKYIAGMKFEDWYINLQLAKYYKFKFFNEILLSYRWHTCNTIKNKTYLENSAEKVLEYEKQHHRRWFDKYAGKKAREMARRANNQAS